MNMLTSDVLLSAIISIAGSAKEQLVVALWHILTALCLLWKSVMDKRILFFSNKKQH